MAYFRLENESVSFVTSSKWHQEPPKKSTVFRYIAGVMPWWFDLFNLLFEVHYRQPFNRCTLGASVGEKPELLG